MATTDNIGHTPVAARKQPPQPPFLSATHPLPLSFHAKHSLLRPCLVCLSFLPCSLLLPLCLSSSVALHSWLTPKVSNQFCISSARRFLVARLSIRIDFFLLSLHDLTLSHEKRAKARERSSLRLLDHKISFHFSNILRACFHLSRENNGPSGPAANRSRASKPSILSSRDYSTCA